MEGEPRGGCFRVQRKMVVARPGVALEAGGQAGVKALTGEECQDAPRRLLQEDLLSPGEDWEEQGLGTPRATWPGPPLLPGQDPDLVLASEDGPLPPRRGGPPQGSRASQGRGACLACAGIEAGTGVWASSVSKGEGGEGQEKSLDLSGKVCQFP